MELDRLSQPWALVLWAALALAALVVAAVRARHDRRGSALPVAGTERLYRAPAFRAVLRRYRGLLAAAAACTLVALSGVALLGARAQAATDREPERISRDIVLCLDVSGSMYRTDAHLLRAFQKIVAGLEGDRVALSIFNRSSVTVFPLTDDHDFVTEQLDQAITALEKSPGSFTAGTLSGQGGASLIGDGLTECLARFDAPGSPRPRSVILATDNQVNGREVVPLPQARDLAVQRGIRIFAIAPSQGNSEPDIAELTQVAESSGGSLHHLNGGAVEGDAIVQGIAAQEAQRIPRQRPERVMHDVPVPGTVLLCVGVLGLLAVVWRLDR